MTTTANDTIKKSPLDWVWWLVFLALIAGGLWANYYYQGIAAPLKVIAWIVLVAVALAITLLTSQGKRAFNFIKSARGELRKVVWPTRPEVVQTTLVVLALVIVLSLIIWGLDSFLLWAVGLLTGQRG